MNSVLIVEDEKHLADGLRYNLKAEGYDVETVGTAEDAFSRLTGAGKNYDVVVLDVMLPGMDGFSLASNLRSEGHFVPILMLTARGQAEDVLRGFEAGADDYLPKPFDLSVLLARIARRLARARSIRELREDNAALDARVVTRAIELGEARAALQASEAELLRLQRLVARS